MAYFDNSWALTEALFAGLQGPEGAYVRVCSFAYLSTLLFIIHTQYMDDGPPSNTDGNQPQAG